MRLPALFSNGMVLQRECPIPVWGWAEPGKSITVKLAGNSMQVAAGREGRWQVRLPAQPAGGPHTLTVQGDGAIEVQDVMVGEVWLCSGQSNMEFPLELARQADLEVPRADFPQIRFLSVPQQIALTPAEDVKASWSRCTPLSAANFSAVGYFFGRELHRRLAVPLGLINASWGGTVAQAWTSRESLASDVALRAYLEALDLPEAVLSEYRTKLAEFFAKLPQDAGNRGLAEGWASIEYNDSAWSTMELPRYWSRAGHPTNGIFWFRRVVEVPQDWLGHDLRLLLGAVDKSDDTYVNGERIGGMSWAQEPQSWSTPREYLIPAKLVRSSRLVLAVRVVSNYTGGGIIGPANAMGLQPVGISQATALPLHGPWRYKIEQDFGLVKGISQPLSPIGPNRPTTLFNAMIAPLRPYALRGVVWYQGESNAGDAARYRTLFPTLIKDWRRQWNQGDFPFYFVQLANYGQPTPARESDNSSWAELREAQAGARTLPNTAMAVAIDIGEQNDIHPRNKQDVGLRLALNALALSYGQKLEYAGPRFRALKVQDQVLQIEFEHADELTARGCLQGFAIAGKDRIFHLAEAQIDGRIVRLSSSAVPVPVAARYGWADCPTCTLYNGAGLPAEPFRTDDWPLGRVAQTKQ